MGEGGRGGGGGAGTLSKISQDYPPPPPTPTVYKQFINNPCARMLSTRMLSSVLLSTLRSACMPMCLCAVEPGNHYGF